MGPRAQLLLTAVSPDHDGQTEWKYRDERKDCSDFVIWIPSTESW